MLALVAVDEQGEGGGREEEAEGGGHEVGRDVDERLLVALQRDTGAGVVWLEARKAGGRAGTPRGRGRRGSGGASWRRKGKFFLVGKPLR